MNYKQHKFVGDTIRIGNHVTIPKRPKVRGRILFSRKEFIEGTDNRFLNELKEYNKTIADVATEALRDRIEHSKSKLEVRRSFGDVNAWSGDHAKLNTMAGTTRNFSSDHISLQEVDDSQNVEYAKLALGNWEHFMPLSYRCWANFHREAVRFAKRFQKSKKKGYRTVDTPSGPAVVFDLDASDLGKALFLEAYGCHFLEDCFASGHLRTPRLLFGKNPLIARNSMYMHDEDNARRLWVMNGNKESFRLIGESDKKDDFAKLRAGKKDAHMAALLKQVVDTMSMAIQEVLDYAYLPNMPGKVNFYEIRKQIPRLQVSWRKLGKNRSRTHSLEIWPVANVETPNPLFKIHANYNPRKKTFEDPMIIKRDDETKWRRIFLGNDVNLFTPGKGFGWWIPTVPEKKKYLP